ncbi:MAG: TIGR02453 family protein [Deltaproteobacteria bacterium]|nr:TIGR02453 family protein [Deltaproteobacteria bacterium]
MAAAKTATRKATKASATKTSATKASATAKPAKKPAAPPALARFTGFPREAPRFFHELAIEMNREWFAAHKAEYEAMWVAPMTALLAELAAALPRSYPGATLAPPKLMRIHRDVRFAADKTPYKTHIAGIISLGGGAATESAAPLYLHLGLDEYCGAGLYGFAPPQLERWRKAIAADKTGAEIARLLGAARADGLTLGAQQVLSRTPPQLAPDHPRAELLRHKGCVLGFPEIPAGLIHQAGFRDWLLTNAQRAAPVVRWIMRHVA